MEKYTHSWDYIELTTGVSRPGGDKVVREKGLRVEEMWLLCDEIENSGLSPRLKNRYTQAVELMFYGRLSVDQVLNATVDDVQKIVSQRAICGTGYKLDRERGEKYFHAPHRHFIPLSASSFLKGFLPFVDQAKHAINVFNDDLQQSA
jgi:hypothetical protein